MKFEPIQPLSGITIGYALPPEIEKLSNSFVKMQTLSNNFVKMQTLSNNFVKMQNLSLGNIDFLLPPIPELSNIKELVQVQNLGNKLLGLALPPEIQQFQHAVEQLKITLNLKTSAFSRFYNDELLNYMQSLVDNIDDEIVDKEQATESISQATDELAKNGWLSFSTIIKLMMFLITIISSYSSMKEIYQDVTYNPIVEMCGVLTELEKEMVKFVKVEHRAGIPLYKYPNGKKEVAFLMNGTQICMLSEPKGNVKRVKVVYQMENHKQTYGYVDRNKLKRLYKID